MSKPQPAQEALNKTLSHLEQARQSMERLCVIGDWTAVIQLKVEFNSMEETIREFAWLHHGIEGENNRPEFRSTI